MGARVVVTGGAGFLGSHLCEQLVEDGCDVLCLDDLSTGAAANVAHLGDSGRFRLVRADVTDFVHVAGPVDAVSHFASPASPVDYFRRPVETLKVGSRGTLHALGLAKEKDARFLLASTSETYGDPQALAGEPLTVAGYGSQTRSICYVDDLANGLVRLLRSDLPGPVNIGNPHELTVLTLATWIRDLAGSDSPVTFVPRPEDDPCVRQPDITLARRELGWEPRVSVGDGLRRTVDWFRTTHGIHDDSAQRPRLDLDQQALAS